MIDITINDNYIYFINSDNDIVTDRPVCDIKIVRKYVDSTEYTVYYRNGVIDSLCGIEFTDFSLGGVPFTDQQTFEDWKNLNTANCGSGSSGGGSTDVSGVISEIQGTNIRLDALIDGEVTTSSYPTGQNTNIPSGYRSVTIDVLSGDVTIDLGSGTVELGDTNGRSGMIVEGDRIGNTYGVTPAITITTTNSATWQWIATEVNQ